MFAKAVNVRKNLIVQKMSQSWHLEPVKNAATFTPSHFSFPVFSDATGFWPLQTVLRGAFCPHATFCLCALQLTASAWTLSQCHYSAFGLERHSGPLLRCWAGAATQVWCQLTFDTSSISPSYLITLCSSSLLRSGLRHLWGGLVQSQLLNHSQVLHRLHPHLLLFYPRDDHALLIRLHHKNGEKHQCHVSRRLSHRTSAESRERRDQGGFQF